MDEGGWGDAKGIFRGYDKPGGLARYTKKKKEALRLLLCRQRKDLALTHDSIPVSRRVGDRNDGGQSSGSEHCFPPNKTP